MQESSRKEGRSHHTEVEILTVNPGSLDKPTCPDCGAELRMRIAHTGRLSPRWKSVWHEPPVSAGLLPRHGDVRTANGLDASGVEVRGPVTHEASVALEQVRPARLEVWSCRSLAGHWHD